MTIKDGDIVIGKSSLKMGFIALVIKNSSFLNYKKAYRYYQHNRSWEIINKFDSIKKVNEIVI